MLKAVVYSNFDSLNNIRLFSFADLQKDRLDILDYGLHIPTALVVNFAENLHDPAIEQICHQYRKIFKNSGFVAILLPEAAEISPPSLVALQNRFKVNSVNYSVMEISHILDQLIEIGNKSQAIVIQKRESQKAPRILTCPFCQCKLSFEQLWVHVPLYHSNEPMKGFPCPLCQEASHDVAGHINSVHFGDYALSKNQNVSRKQVRQVLSRQNVAVMIVLEANSKVVVVQETKQKGWSLPGGFVRSTESPYDAVKRIALHEAGVLLDEASSVNLLSIDYEMRSSLPAITFYFHISLQRETSLKSVPDPYSVLALWVKVNELPLGPCLQRHIDPLQIMKRKRLQNGMKTASAPATEEPSIAKEFFWRGSQSTKILQNLAQLKGSSIGPQLFNITELKIEQ